MKNLKIKWKINLLAFGMVFITIVLLSSYISWEIHMQAENEIKNFEQRVMELKKKDLKSVTNIVFSFFDHASKESEIKTQEKLKANLEIIYALINTKYHLAQNSANPNEAMRRAKKELMKDFDKLFFDSTGYVWIHSFDSNNVDKPFMLMHPVDKSMVGTDVSDFRYYSGEKKGEIIYALDVDENIPFIVQMNRLLTKDSIAFVSYMWPKPGHKEYQPKTSCVRLFKPWGWVLGTGAYIKDIEPELKKEVLKDIKHFRFGANNQDYYWVHSYNPDNPDDVKMIMHPIIPSLDGQDISEIKYNEGEKKGEIVYALGIEEKVPFFVQINRDISKGNEGTVRYEWPKPDDKGLSEYQPKLSYYKRFPEWNWVIGTGVYLDEVEAMKQDKRNEVSSHTSRMLLILIIVSFTVMAISFVTILSLSKTIVNPVKTLVLRMKEYTGGDRKLSELPKSNDEIGDLSNAFSELRLENINLLNKLHEKVAEQTNRLAREKELSELKSQFINMITHEYKTPLTVISSSIMLIEMSTKGCENEEIRKSINRVNISVKALTELIDNVISFAGSDRLDLQFLPKPVNINAICEQLIQEIKVFDSQNHIFVTNYYDDPINIMSDKNFIKQILSQALRNAMKFSPENSRIELLVEDYDKKVAIRIIDNGIGIPNDDLEKIFNPFFKNEETIGLQSGIGLGLSIAKKYADAINGEITVKSELNKGTCFNLSLPKIYKEV